MQLGLGVFGSGPLLQGKLVARHSLARAVEALPPLQGIEASYTGKLYAQHWQIMLLAQLGSLECVEGLFLTGPCTTAAVKPLPPLQGIAASSRWLAAVGCLPSSCVLRRPLQECTACCKSALHALKHVRTSLKAWQRLQVAGHHRNLKGCLLPPPPPVFLCRRAQAPSCCSSLAPPPAC